MTPQECFDIYRETHGKNPLSKQDVYNLLSSCGIEFEVAEHPAVATVEEASKVNIPFEEHMAKNFFLRDDKKRNYYLVTVPERKTIDLKNLQAKLESRRLSFASPVDLAQKLGVWPGSVTPFAALNEDTLSVQVVLDSQFEVWGYIGCHPCDNTASVHLKTTELERLIQNHGNPFKVLEI